MEKDVNIWYDAEGDYLEVLFFDKPGYMTPTDHDAVMEMVDETDNILGFSITALSKFLKPAAAGQSPRTCSQQRPDLPRT